MSLPSFSVRNQVLVNMLMFAMLIGGLMFSVTLVREMFPESRPTKLSISAIYPGVQPQEIEKAVTIKVEEAVRDVEGIEKVDSYVVEGMTVVTLTLLNEVSDVDAVLQEVESEVNAIQDIPADVEQLTVKKFEPELPVISIAMYGDGDEAGLKRAVRRLQEDLQRLPGISRVTINGSRDDEISVEIVPEKLLEYDVTFDEVAASIRNTNLDISGGQIKGSRNTFSVRTLGEESRGRELEDLVVRSQPDGKKIYLRDVATVRDEFIDVDLESMFNGKPSMSCVVYKTKSQDAIQIAQLVKAYVYGKQNAPFDPHGYEEAKNSPWYVRPFNLAMCGFGWMVNKVSGRPDPVVYYEKSRQEPFEHNFEIALHTNMARFVEGRLDLMTRNGKAGLILVLVSLYMFLNWRIAFWAATGLVVSFLGTFVVMWLFGSSINLLTMFGLIIVLGIIVDDAIVIGENIYRHVEEGEDPKVAAVKGAEEVMWPVVVAVLTTIGAFMPMFFIKGQIGDFMRQLPIVVVSALSVSLLEALIILPAHLSHLPKRKKPEEQQADQAKARKGRWLRFSHWQEHIVKDVLIKNYERFLRFALRWRYVTLSVAFASVVLAFGLVAGDIVHFEFIQKMDSETVICSVEMPVGTTAENVREKLKSLSDHIMAQEEVAHAQMFVARQIDLSGTGAVGNNDQSHLGQIIVELMPADVRDVKGLRSSSELLVNFRKFSNTLTGTNSIAWEEMTGGPGGKDIEIKVTGRDFDEILKVRDELRNMLAGYAGVFDLDDNFDEGKREVQLRLRESAAVTGMQLVDLGSQVRGALYGREARRLTRNREDVRIMVRYPEEYRQNVYQVESMWVPSQTVGEGRRVWIPLREVAEIKEDTSYTTIHRSQQQRSLTVLGEVDRAVTTPDEVLNDVRRRFDAEIGGKHPGVSIEFLGSFEEMNKSFSSLKIAFPVALLVIYTLLAGLFRSYAQPLVVMSAIPFGFLGAIIGHYLTDNPLTILSMIGMLALTGILVNDSLVLVDFVNQRIREGQSQLEASIEGSKLRLRAILLTTLTTVAGLLPLMFETSFQAKFLIPMAVTLTFGLMFATLLTLLVVPTLNMIFFDVTNFLSSDTPNSTIEAPAPESATAAAS